MPEGDGGARGRAFAMASMFFTERKERGGPAAQYRTLKTNEEWLARKIPKERRVQHEISGDTWRCTDVGAEEHQPCLHAEVTRPVHVIARTRGGPD